MRKIDLKWIERHPDPVGLAARVTGGRWVSETRPLYLGWNELQAGSRLYVRTSEDHLEGFTIYSREGRMVHRIYARRSQAGAARFLLEHLALCPHDLEPDAPGWDALTEAT